MTTPLRTYGKRKGTTAAAEARKRVRASLSSDTFDDLPDNNCESSALPELSHASTSDAASEPPSTPRDDETTTSPRAARLANRQNKSDLRSFFTAAPVSFATASTPERKPKPKVAKRKTADEDYAQQYELDISLKPSMGTCTECGMANRRGAPEDVRLHTKHHKRVVGGVDFALSGNEELLEQDIAVSKEDDTGCIIAVDGLAKGSQGKKVAEILEMIDTELSSTQIPKDALAKCKLFLLVSRKQKRVLACAVAGPTSSAFAVIAAAEEDKEGLLRFGEDSTSIFAANTSVPAHVGIHRIWTCRTARRHGLAVRLLDAVASRFVYAQHLHKSDIAFSQPTGDGAALAKAWTGKQTGWKVFEG